MRAEAIGRLSSFKDCAFLAERFRAENSYVVQAEALRAIGACGDRGQLPLLREATTMPSPFDSLRRAAESALVALEKKVVMGAKPNPQGREAH